MFVKKNDYFRVPCTPYPAVLKSCRSWGDLLFLKFISLEANHSTFAANFKIFPSSELPVGRGTS